MDQEFFPGGGGRINHPINVDRARARVMAHVQAESKPRRVWVSARYMGITAALVLIIAGIIYIPTIKPTPQTKTYSTTTGQRANIKLADGSNVILAPATTMHVSGRNVGLTGEAIFTVNQNTGAPFTVRAANTTTRVLGTHFSVRAYAQDKAVRVAVQDGKVAFAHTVLSAGEVGRVTAEGITTVDNDPNINDIFAWTDAGRARHVFRRVALQDVITDIERWYGVKIAMPQSLTGVPFTGVITASGANEAISTLAASLGVEVRRDGTNARFVLKP